MRCVHESQMHKENCFITLTYNNEELPENGTLVKRDLQLFFKKLRKKLDPKKIRYYACGEYGDENGRPHYHACLFNYIPTDGVLVRERDDYKLYYSKTLDKIWEKGLTTYGALTFESAAYTARYVTKKINGDKADEHYKRVDPETGEIIQLLPEFATMSRRPGIGTEWYKKYKTDVFPSDEVILRQQKMKPPKFYDKILEIEKPELHDQIKSDRIISADKHKENNTQGRLKIREAVARAKINLKKRGI